MGDLKLDACEARGDEVRGLPFITIWWKRAAIECRDSELVIRSGWTLKAELRIPLGDIVSCEWDDAGYGIGDYFYIRYKRRDAAKEVVVRLMPRIRAGLNITRSEIIKYMKEKAGAKEKPRG
ncbi:MAG: hypothetical protein AB1324_02845 [Candidatus Micrarchaeota archaeon]